LNISVANSITVKDSSMNVSSSNKLKSSETSLRERLLDFVTKNNKLILSIKFLIFVDIGLVRLAHIYNFLVLLSTVRNLIKRCVEINIL